MSRGPGMLVNAVAAKDEHFVAAKIDIADVGHIDRAVAHHSRRIIERSARGRLADSSAGTCRLA